ncbi:MAG TPA: 2OG-Fe(II) oxygenase [Hyphomicrobiaceae bacterium]|nr:2OG-Fe(II) oxygenase [Hyphomicrobiaceae bacterium]
MPGICEELAELLSTVQRPGDFYATGRSAVLLPRLEIDGVGQVALPLLPVQAQQLIEVADQAPYGRGSETIVDTSVRRTWQIGPDRVRLDGKHWKATLDRIVGLVAEGLGVGEPISASLYKLLIYDEGSFFVGHRDTEKEPGMFATLVLALPSLSSGGELVVRHKGREVKLDLAGDEPSEVAFAAFYADCVHEVRPVTAGCRATLIYNLVRRGKGSTLTPPSYDRETGRVTALLQDWVRGTASRSAGTPEKVIYPLEHAYTPAELDFAKLKGADAAAAALLKAAAPQAGCDLHLAVVSIGESGAAEHCGYYDEDEFEVVEVFDRWQNLTEWRQPDGGASALGEIPIEDGEVSPPDALEDMEPDEEHFHEATGNEGASFERTYRHAAMVLWPRQRRLAVINQAGPGVTLPYLDALAAKWIEEGARADSAIWAEAHVLSGHILATWPASEGYGGLDDSDGDEGYEADEVVEDGKRSGLARLVSSLTKLKDEARIVAAIDLLTARRRHDEADNAAILAGVALFPPKRAAGMIEAVVASHASKALAPSCALLRAAIAGPFAANPRHLATAASRLVASLPGDPALAPVDEWGRRRRVAPGAGVVADLVMIAEAIDAELARQLAQHLLAWSSTWNLDRALVPAVRRLLAAGVRKSGASMKKLHAACLKHLEVRAAEPLEAPKDWTRSSNIGCKCEHCSALSLFLASPTSEAWTLKAAEQVRNHVEREIKAARADLDLQTERRGRPYALICRKNRASYERRVAQRRQDQADITALKGAL